MADLPLTTHRSPLTRTDWLLIGVLIALVLPLRLWLICNTEVTARDSIGYIRYALQFEKDSWAVVLQNNQQHPGYPFLVRLMSVPVRAIEGETTPENMELATQLVNFLASLLLIVPTYLLGRQFFDRPVSFFGTLLYQYLPTSAQHLSDGISEPIFLVLMVTGLLQAVLAIRERAIWRCALCGLIAGLAYLTRPEGALLLPAFGCVLIGMQFHSAWRSSWKRFLACGTATVLTAMLIGSIYVSATGTLTNKPSAIDMFRLKRFAPKEAQAIHPANAGLHLFAATFSKTDSRTIRSLRSIGALFSEITQGFHYVAALPCLLGICLSFGALRRNPGFWVVIAFGIIHSLILVALGIGQGYVSDRHVMILVLLGCFFVAVGMYEFPRRVLAWYKASGSSWATSAPVWFTIFAVALIAVCLPKAVQRLHGNRVGNHAAGAWLSNNLKVGDHVEDDHSWSHFTSGWFFKESETPVLSSDCVPTTYVVITTARELNFNVPETISYRTTTMDVEYVSRDAKVVYAWPENGDLKKARVVILAQPRDWTKNPWTKSAK